MQAKSNFHKPIRKLNPFQASFNTSAYLFAATRFSESLANFETIITQLKKAIFISKLQHDRLLLSRYLASCYANKALCIFSQSHLKLNAYEEVMAANQLSLGLNHLNHTVYYNQFSLLYQKGQMEDALDNIVCAIVCVRLLLSSLRDDPANREEDCMKASEYCQNCFESYLLRLQLQIQGGKIRLALNTLRWALECDPNNPQLLQVRKNIELYYSYPGDINKFLTECMKLVCTTKRKSANVRLSSSVNADVQFLEDQLDYKLLEYNELLDELNYYGSTTGVFDYAAVRNIKTNTYEVIHIATNSIRATEYLQNYHEVLAQETRREAKIKKQLGSQTNQSKMTASVSRSDRDSIQNSRVMEYSYTYAIKTNNSSSGKGKYPTKDAIKENKEDDSRSHMTNSLINSFKGNLRSKTFQRSLSTQSPRSELLQEENLLQQIAEKVVNERSSVKGGIRSSRRDSQGASQRNSRVSQKSNYKGESPRSSMNSSARDSMNNSVRGSMNNSIRGNIRQPPKQSPFQCPQKPLAVTREYIQGSLYPYIAARRFIELTILNAQLSHIVENANQLQKSFYCVATYNANSLEGAKLKSVKTCPILRESSTNDYEWNDLLGCLKLTEEPTRLEVKLFKTLVGIKKPQFIGEAQMELSSIGVIRMEVLKDLQKVGSVLVKVARLKEKRIAVGVSKKKRFDSVDLKRSL